MSTGMKPDRETELSVLKEILKWVKFTGMKEVRDILMTTLDDEQERNVYQLSDGTKGIVEIGKIVGIKSPTTTIFNMWKQWTNMGLGEPVPVKGGSRFKRSFDLEDFGIEVSLKATNEKVEADQKAEAKSLALTEFQQSSGETPANG
jgi:hypothetical protein